MESRWLFVRGGLQGSGNRTHVFSYTQTDFLFKNWNIEKNLIKLSLLFVLEIFDIKYSPLEFWSNFLGCVICVHVFPCVWTHVYRSMRRPDIDTASSSIPLHPKCWGRVSHLNTEPTSSSRAVNQISLESRFGLLSTGSPSRPSCPPSLYLGAGDPNSSSSCPANTAHSPVSSAPDL